MSQRWSWCRNFQFRCITGKEVGKSYYEELSSLPGVNFHWYASVNIPDFVVRFPLVKFNLSVVNKLVLARNKRKKKNNVLEEDDSRKIEIEN